MESSVLLTASRMSTDGAIFTNCSRKPIMFTTVLLGSELLSSPYSEPFGPAAKNKGFINKRLLSQIMFALDLYVLLGMQLSDGLFD